MKKQEKIYAVENLTEQIRDAKSIFLTDYRGLTVSQISDLRSQIKKSGGQMSVVKNTLLARALASLKLELPKEDLEGPTAVVIALEDEIAPLKAVAAFAKAAGLPSFKSGIMNDRALTREEIKTLSLIPSRADLMAKLMGVLLSPTHRFMGVLSNNPRKLIILLKKMEESANQGSAQTKTEEKVEVPADEVKTEDVIEETKEEVKEETAALTETPTEEPKEEVAPEAEVEEGGSAPTEVSSDETEGGDKNNG